jgi:hypothetical protein
LGIFIAKSDKFYSLKMELERTEALGLTHENQQTSLAQNDQRGDISTLLLTTKRSLDENQEHRLKKKAAFVLKVFQIYNIISLEEHY